MATKEDILEQIVEEYLTHEGYFVRHNVKFLPRKDHPEFVLNQHSNHSDIDVIGYLAWPALLPREFEIVRDSTIRNIHVRRFGRHLRLNMQISPLDFRRSFYLSHHCRSGPICVIVHA